MGSGSNRRTKNFVVLSQRAQSPRAVRPSPLRRNSLASNATSLTSCHYPLVHHTHHGDNSTTLPKKKKKLHNSPQIRSAPPSHPTMPAKEFRLAGKRRPPTELDLDSAGCRLGCQRARSGHTRARRAMGFDHRLSHLSSSAALCRRRPRAEEDLKDMRLAGTSLAPSSCLCRVALSRGSGSWC